MDPLVLFYDEPTTGLDPEHSQRIQDLVREVHLRQPEPGVERTTVIVTHDIGLLYRLRPRVIMLHQGQVLFDGATAEFQRSDSPYIRPYLDLMPLLNRQDRETVGAT
jgi:phospholipid/cholesterol/gamma-HCH transport system ATP-binding protein